VREVERGTGGGRVEAVRRVVGAGLLREAILSPIRGETREQVGEVRGKQTTSTRSNNSFFSFHPTYSLRRSRAPLEHLQTPHHSSPVLLRLPSTSSLPLLLITQLLPSSPLTHHLKPRNSSDSTRVTPQTHCCSLSRLYGPTTSRRTAGTSKGLPKPTRSLSAYSSCQKATKQRLPPLCSSSSCLH
jgi:hypothetical protein